MKDGILALLYSVEAENIELAVQLISGLEQGAEKAELLLTYGQLVEAAAHFKCSIAAMFSGLAEEEALVLILNDFTKLPDWLAALSGRIERASLRPQVIDLAKGVENIAHLKGLKALTIDVQKAEDIEAFLGLTELEWLICHIDEGGKLSENIGELHSLQLLKLYCNKEIALPESFGTLSNLEIFDCQYPIKSAALGAQVFGLPSLRILSIDAVALVALPTAVKGTNLEVC